MQHPLPRPDPREALGLAWDAIGGRILLFGGRDAPGGYYHDFDDTWAWDGSSWTCLARCS